MRSTPLENGRIVFTVVGAGALSLALLSSCSDGSNYHPTEPVQAPAGPETLTWVGAWSVDHVTPAGDCLADALNDPVYHWEWNFDLDFQREGDVVRLNFDLGQGNDDFEGFWPIEFAGTIDRDGFVVASVPPERIGQRRTDPWMELCYWDWATEGGELEATLSPDGRSLTGTIVERFRVLSNGRTFTVHSRFTAEYR
jgi:hypothetical protein